MEKRARSSQSNALRAREELWRGPGGQPNALRTGRSGRGGLEGCQTHSQSREEWWRRPGGQPNALRAGKSGGGRRYRQPNDTQSREEWWRGREGSQTHSDSGGVVEGSRRAAKCYPEPREVKESRRAAKGTQSREECRRCRMGSQRQSVSQVQAHSDTMVDTDWCARAPLT